jgi:signal transduction histidine kinase
VIEPYRMGLADRIEIDAITAPDVPNLVIDRTLFARALTNVIENALHAMPGKGRLTIMTRRAARADADLPAKAPEVGRGERRAVSSGTPAVAPRSPADDGWVIVTTSDTGVGMDREAVGRIFEPYFSTKATGTGLGLTIAKRNVELNRGRIDVQSERGVGTTVTMTLPIREA